MALSSWLFIRDQESIWIERPHDFSVIVAGPGSARAHLLFPNDDALQAYQIATAERLTRAGWFLWGFDQERRTRDDGLAAHIDLNRQSKRDRRASDLAGDGMTFGSGRE
jgi:hypothetical protein